MEFVIHPFPVGNEPTVSGTSLPNTLERDHIASASTVVGQTYELPMKEDLRDGIETFSPIAIQRPNDSYNNTYWMVTDPTEVSAIFANQSGEQERNLPCLQEMER
mgnify:CR=1 FL=1